MADLCVVQPFFALELLICLLLIGIHLEGKQNLGFHSRIQMQALCSLAASR